MPKHTGIVMPNLQHNTVLNKDSSGMGASGDNAKQD